MSDPQTGELDVSNPVLGSIRAKGYRLSDLLWPLVIVGLGYTSLTLYNHSVEAKDEKEAIAKSLKESHAQTAQALKESNANTAEAIRQMATEQKKATNVLREMSCLLDPQVVRRSDAREFCKRITRDER